MMLEVLNIFFFIFHTALILFNVLGWAVKKLRPWNLNTLMLTGFSWFVLGIWQGWGYCICTDWHYDVRAELGYTDMVPSYIQFLIKKITGILLPADLVDTATVLVFFGSLGASIYMNYRDANPHRE